MGKPSKKAGHKDKGGQETEKEITNLLIKQIQNPTIDFQFGEVQEILDELNKTKSQKNEESTILTRPDDDSSMLTDIECDLKSSRSSENTIDKLLTVDETRLPSDSDRDAFEK